MANYRMQGQELQNSSNYQRIATIDGGNILDATFQRVGEVRDNEIFDARYQKVAAIQGDDIIDASYQKIGSVSQARNSIDGAAGGATVAALWYFFIR